MKINIRKAKPDEAKVLAEHVILAMEAIVFSFIGRTSHKEAVAFLSSLISEKGNQYSYENCHVLEIDGAIVGVAVVYDGSKLYELRLPVAQKIKELYQRNFSPEDETAAGEFYIDSIGINPQYQGKGMGSILLKFLIEIYVNQKQKTLGLLVEKNNPAAKKLYMKLGFKVVGEQTLAGKYLEHLQLHP